MIKKIKAYFKNLSNNQVLINNKIKELENTQRNLQNECNANLQRIENYINETNNVLNRAMNAIYDIENIHIPNFNNANLKYVNLELLKLKYDPNKKNILLCGFYGGDNIGDELMLQTLCEYFSKYNNIKLTLMLDYNDKYDILKNNNKNISYIHYPKSSYDYFNIVDNFDTIIFGGGALIDDNTYNNDPFKISLSKILIDLTTIFIDNNKKSYWLGLSTNKEFKNDYFIEKLKYIMNNKNAYVSFRDTNSLNTLNNKGIDTKNIIICNDIILANKELSNLELLSSKTIKIGIIPICFRELYDQNLLMIKRIIAYLNSNKIKYKIDLIPFYDYIKNDYNMLCQLKNDLNDKNVNVIEFKSKFKDVIDIINNHTHIISMRYHASLIAIVENKPLLTICLSQHSHYSNKMNYIYKKYTKSDNLIESKDVSNKTKLNNALNTLFKLENNCFDNKVFETSQKELNDIIERIVNDK